mmetsp:Transcript_105733/g.266109  ORF Transcript_105733/g.266109 Transcript_105733/m.266109 type:complete len:207 (-) Transcript_105733:1569-2189(-)
MHTWATEAAPRPLQPHRMRRRLQLQTLSESAMRHTTGSSRRPSTVTGRRQPMASTREVTMHITGSTIAPRRLLRIRHQEATPMGHRQPMDIGLRLRAIHHKPAIRHPHTHTLLLRTATHLQLIRRIRDTHRLAIRHTQATLRPMAIRRRRMAMATTHHHIQDMRPCPHRGLMVMGLMGMQTNRAASGSESGLVRLGQPRRGNSHPQ